MHALGVDGCQRMVGGPITPAAQPGGEKPAGQVIEAEVIAIAQTAMVGSHRHQVIRLQCTSNQTKQAPSTRAEPRPSGDRRRRSSRGWVGACGGAL